MSANCHTASIPKARARQAGVTLVELMISLVIGLVVISALIALYAGSVGSNRVTSAQAEMNEDAQFALQHLVGQLRQAGYNPYNAGHTHTFALPSTHAVFGCAAGFSNPTTATSTTALTCNAASGPASAAISIAYEADIYNTVPLGASPTNCVGVALTGRTDPDTGVTYYAAENRYYVRNRTLYCAGVSGPPTAHMVAEQALVENVERIEFSYGSTSFTGTATAYIAGYLTATQLGPATGIAAAPVHEQFVSANHNAQTIWGTVSSIRVCVVMRSATPVFEEDVTSFGCDATVSTTPDRYLRRAYVATVALRNKVTIE